MKPETCRSNHLIPQVVEKEQTSSESSNRMVSLTCLEVADIVNLIADHPALSLYDKNFMHLWSQRYSENQSRSPIGIRTCKAGILELLQTLRPGLYDNEKIKEIYNSTDFVIIDKDNYHPDNFPSELKYALGIGGAYTLLKLEESFKKGDKLVFMKVHKLPNHMHDDLHTIIDACNGATQKVIDLVETRGDGEIESVNSQNALPSDMYEVITRLHQHTSELLHVRIISPRPDDSRSDDLEKEINDIIDQYIDMPYALWSYTVDALKGDVAMAGIALATATIVAEVLTKVGLNGLTVGIPAIVSEFMGSIGTAQPFWKEEDKTLKALAKIVTETYWPSITAAVVLSLVCGQAYQTFLQNSEIFMNQILAAFALGIPPLLTSYINDWCTKSRFRKSGQKSEEASEHPVTSGVRKAGLGSFASTIALAPAGLLKDAGFVALTTEAMEPVIIGISALISLWQKQSEFKGDYDDGLHTNAGKLFHRLFSHLQQLNISDQDGIKVQQHMKEIDKLRRNIEIHDYNKQYVDLYKKLISVERRMINLLCGVY